MVFDLSLFVRIQVSLGLDMGVESYGRFLSLHTTKDSNRTLPPRTHHFGDFLIAERARAHNLNEIKIQPIKRDETDEKEEEKK